MQFMCRVVNDVCEKFKYTFYSVFATKFRNYNILEFHYTNSLVKSYSMHAFVPSQDP